MFKRKQKCQACDKRLTTDPALVYIDNHEFEVCDECERLLNTLTKKFEEREDLNEQSLSVLRDDKYYEEEFDEEFGE